MPMAMSEQDLVAEGGRALQRYDSERGAGARPTIANVS
jgi:hypothetical protein